MEDKSAKWIRVQVGVSPQSTVCFKMTTDLKICWILFLYSLSIIEAVSTTSTTISSPASASTTTSSTERSTLDWSMCVVVTGKDNVTSFCVCKTAFLIYGGTNVFFSVITTLAVLVICYRISYLNQKETEIKDAEAVWGQNIDADALVNKKRRKGMKKSRKTLVQGNNNSNNISSSKNNNNNDTDRSDRQGPMSAYEEEDKMSSTCVQEKC